MKPLLIAALSVAFLQGCSIDENTQPDLETIKAPVAKKVAKELTIHGDTRIDNYYWLRDDTRSDPEILAHLQAEEDYTQQQLGHTQKLQTTLFDEMVGRLKKDESSVPVLSNGYLYQSKFVPGSEYKVYVRTKDEAGAKEEILLDGNKLAEGLEYFALGAGTVSSDNNILAYSEDVVSRRMYTVKFKNLTTGENYKDEITGTSGSVVWSNDSTTVYYIEKNPETLLGYKVMKHTLGTSQADDVVIYEEKDNTFYTDISKSLDNQYIMIYHSHTVSLGNSVIDANNANSAAKLLHKLEVGLEYWVTPHGDDFYILNNDNANNFKISKADKKDVNDKTKWQDVIAHDENVFISNMIVLKDSLVYTQRENGLISMKVLNFATKQVSTIRFDESLYIVDIDDNRNFNSNTVRVSYESMVTPASILDINLASFERNLLKQTEVVGGYDASLYESKRLMLNARDGAKVPVSIVYRKDKFKQDGTNPLLQYAYGSYGSTIDPYFSASTLSLIDRGFVYAIAHIRGSQMLGRPWYEDGKMLTKINTFNDFVDVTNELVAQKYGARGKIFAQGGSAGGLLMGAVINQAPELYKGVVAGVPFVDVVTTMLDATIPLTTGEWDEWGNPINKEYYDYMKSYSPYDNVEAKAYPNLLVTTGLHDSQVQYFEPAKWVAKLRDMKTDDNQLLFHINMEAGHGGASGRYKRYEDRALIYAFYIDLLK